jgi:hypothetical protein
MKYLPHILPVMGLTLIGCGTTNFGKLEDVKEYGVLYGNVSEGFARMEASVIASTAANTNSAELQTKLGRKFTVTWTKGLPSFESLDPNKPYLLDLIVFSGPNLITNPSAAVYRISEGDRIIADLSRCSIHKCAMYRAPDDWIDGYALQKKGKVKQYPNSGIFHAVCNSGMHYVGWVCPECREAEQRQIDSLIGRKQPYIP